MRQSRPLLDAEAPSSDAGMVTPPSHLDSGHSTPTFQEVAGAQPLGARQPAGVTGAVGGGDGSDSLAPAEVRQRVLSDAAAAQLAREGQQGGGRGGEPAGEGKAQGAEAEDQMMRLYNAARNATLQMQRGAGGGGGAGPQQGAGGANHHRQTSSLVSADLSDAESLLGTLADTPATPSTGAPGAEG